MKKNWILGLVFLFIAFSCSKDEPVPEEEIRPVNKNFILAAYLPAYSFSKLDADALKKLHRVYYFSVAPDKDGNFVYSQNDIANLNSLKSHYAGTSKQIYLVIGGWYESENIHEMAASETKRKKYAFDIAEFCEQHGLHGVDLDWESYPVAVNSTNYSAWVKELYAELHPRKLGFTIAVDVAHAKRSAGLVQFVDQFNLMSYGILDAAGYHATLTQMLNWLADYKAQHIPSEKLIAGVPFYAQRPSVAGDNSSVAVTYRYILSKTFPAPGVNKYEKYSFNGQDLLREKVRFLMQNNYAGIMAWELTQDAPVSSEYSLLRSVSEEYISLISR